MPERIESFGFECRLREGSDAVDLGFSVIPANGGRDALAGLLSDRRVERAVQASEAWRRLRELALCWRDGSSSLYTWVPFLFLELDADRAVAAFPVPSLFVALDSRLEGAPGVRGAMRDAPELAAAREAGAILIGGAPGDPGDAALVECFDLLPRGARVLHLGVMMGRPDAGLRLSVQLPERDALPYLFAIGEGGTARGAEEVLARLPERSGSVQIDFDLGTAPRGRIGLSLAPLVSDKASWTRLFLAVERIAEVSAPKIEGLLRWPGVGRIPMSKRTTALVRREISHVKIVCTASSTNEAKAYFGAELLTAG